jgi:hypothetical protein
MREAEVKEFHEATKSALPLRRAWIITVLALLGALAWLAFSFYQVVTLRDKASQLQRESEQLDKTIELKKSELQLKKGELTDKQRLIETLAPLLDLTPLVISDPMRAARSKIAVQYVSRDIKPEALAVIKQFGFAPEDKRPPNDTPTTNIIWFGKNVSTDDVKLVAYILVRQDFKVNDIKLFPKSSGSENVIQVGVLGKSKSSSYLTVEQIAEKKTFTDVDVSWLSGMWSGQATQIETGENQGGNIGQWTITLTVQNGKYSVDYPSLSCGGKWTLLKKSAKTIRFKEKITYGDRCADNGFVTIEKRGSSQILFNYIDPAGAGVTSFAILTKQ